MKCRPSAVGCGTTGAPVKSALDHGVVRGRGRGRGQDSEPQRKRKCVQLQVQFGCRAGVGTGEECGGGGVGIGVGARRLSSGEDEGGARRENAPGPEGPSRALLPQR